MKVLALCGSPRTKGNTAYILKNIVEEIRRQGHVAEIIHLSELDIMECNGCLVCEETECTGDCTIHDDIQAYVIPQLLTCDAIVLGSPSYFGLPTAQMKRFMDRSNMVLSQVTKRGLRYGLVVVGQSEKASLDATCRALRRYCKILGMREVAGSPVRAIARDEGDVRNDKSALEAAERLARSLISPRGVVSNE